MSYYLPPPPDAETPSIQSTGPPTQWSIPLPPERPRPKGGKTAVVVLACVAVVVALGVAAAVYVGTRSANDEASPYRPETLSPERSGLRRPQSDVRLPLAGQAEVDEFAVNYTTVLESRSRYGKGATVIATFTNTSAAVLDGYVHVFLLGANDRVLGDDVVVISDLAPGVTTAAMIRLATKDVSGAGLRLAMETSTRRGQADVGTIDVSDVTVAPAASSIPDDPSVQMTGSVRSTDTVPARFPLVMAVFLDEDGQLVAGARASVDELAPGATAKIEEWAPVSGPYREALTPVVYAVYVRGD